VSRRLPALALALLAACRAGEGAPPATSQAAGDAAPSARDPSKGHLLGSLELPDPAPLPPGATGRVILALVTDSSPAPNPIAMTAFPVGGLVSPIGFDLAFDSLHVRPGARFVAGGGVVLGDTLLWMTDTNQAVLTRGGVTDSVVFRLSRPPVPILPNATSSPNPVGRVARALPALRRVDGADTAGDATASWRAYLEGPRVAYVRESLALGELGQSEAEYFFDVDSLALVYEQRVRQRPGRGAGGLDTSTIFLRFRRPATALDSGAVARGASVQPPPPADVAAARRRAARLRDLALREAARRDSLR